MKRSDPAGAEYSNRQATQEQSQDRPRYSQDEGWSEGQEEMIGKSMGQIAIGVFWVQSRDYLVATSVAYVPVLLMD